MMHIYVDKSHSSKGNCPDGGSLTLLSITALLITF